MPDNLLIKKIIKAIIVDDEQHARDALFNYISEFCPALEVVALCGSAKEAYKIINEKKPDLVFLDIDMPQGSGFDLLKMFEKIHFKVVFVTAYSEYAVDAFRYAAVDYLMKPIKVSELIEAVGKVESDLKKTDSFAMLLDLLESFASPKKQNRDFVISTASGFTVVKTNDMVMFQANGYCTKVFLADGTCLSSSHNLKYYDDIFDQQQFMRVHNSYIINIDHVKKYTNTEEIILTGNLKCSLSRSHKQDFLNLYKNKI